MAGEIALLTVEMRLPGIQSLKEKRRILQSMIQKMKSKFNVAVSETDLQDTWQRAELSIVSINTSWNELQRTIGYIQNWIQSQYEIEVIEDRIERL
ncbi:MAG: DUF503 domain-containing protein [Caldisericia bacterium]|nr:DUF503 domain-containing protein [Caldisericia bacterium]